MRTDEYVQAARELFVPRNKLRRGLLSVGEGLEQKPGSVPSAVLFLYLNRYGYNGLCRYNIRGEFNVPFRR